MFDVSIPKSRYSFSSNTYILRSGAECAVIDPSAPYTSAEITTRVKYILLTHAHFDHMLSITEWLENTNAEVIISEYDAPALSDSTLNCYKLFLGIEGGYFGRYRIVKDGDILPLGEDTITVFSYPGHTPGSAAYFAPPFAFVGDTVFAGGGYGRCDLPRGNVYELENSINKLLRLPSDTVLIPGHGDATTVAEYKKCYKSFKI